jgi:hypothetical protein
MLGVRVRFQRRQNATSLWSVHAQLAATIALQLNGQCLLVTIRAFSATICCESAVRR